MNPRPTALLCDADGNLFPSEEPAFDASVDVTNEFLAALGIRQRFTADELRLSTTGKNFRTTAADLAAAHGVHVARDAPLQGPLLVETPVLTAEELQRWVVEEQRRVTAHLGRVLRPDPAVLEPLTRLGAQHLLAAVSSSATGRLAACFAATGLESLIPRERWFSAEDSLPVPTSKPDPAVYRHACVALRIEPSSALAVEDSEPGVQSAVGAGIPTIGNVQFVPADEQAERRRRLLAAGARDVVGSWSELEERLQDGA